MPIISRMERRTWWGRFVMSLIFGLLTLGGLSILYPFAIMVSGSLRSEMDETQLNFIPAFLVSDVALYQKFLEYKYNQDVEAMNRAHLSRRFSFHDAARPEGDAAALGALVQQFMQDTEWPFFWYRLGGIRGILNTPANARAFRQRIVAHFDNDLDRFRLETGAVVGSWLGLEPPAYEWLSRQYGHEPGILFDVYMQLMEESPLAEYDLMMVTGHFLQTMVYPRFGRQSVDRFNAAYPSMNLEDYDDFVLPSSVPGPEHDGFRELWIEYVREEINPSFVALHRDWFPGYHMFLASRYADIDEANLIWGSDYPSFEAVPLPDGRQWLSGSLREDYEAFMRTVPPEALRLNGPDFVWREWLATHFADLFAANAALGTQASSLNAIPLSMAALEYLHVKAHAAPLRRQFASNNYINVKDALFSHGRAFINTVIYCLLVVGLNLLINPMAAYALSRFRLKGTYKILLILMATAAFPPMVTLIPQFVVLQRLNLMNTMIALLLPTLANGYLIFLLKGFFDSLPQDLYDAALIDGAGEIRVFFQITMALSKPILAVVALQSFTMAYTAFLYPLLVAPDQDMWLISVWLYQFQQRSSMSGVFASVLVASIPTLIIFLLAQNIILRGIAVPTEK